MQVYALCNLPMVPGNLNYRMSAALSYFIIFYNFKNLSDEWQQVRRTAQRQDRDK
jgi:hypothetical protein